MRLENTVSEHSEKSILHFILHPGEYYHKYFLIESLFKLFFFYIKVAPPLHNFPLRPREQW